MKFYELLEKTVPQEKRFTGTLLTLDPGETTGFNLFECTANKLPHMTASGQILCDPISSGIRNLRELIGKYKADHVLYENYLVYSWLAQSQSWSSMYTPQLIGVIRTLCELNSIPTDKQMAQQAKAFCTDDKLRDWNFYVKGKHARDSIRHSLYFLLFQHTRKLTTK